MAIVLSSLRFSACFVAFVQRGGARAYFAKIYAKSA
jgi:hypothetical protein